MWTIFHLSRGHYLALPFTGCSSKRKLYKHFHIVWKRVKWHYQEFLTCPKFLEHGYLLTENKSDEIFRYQVKV